MPPSVTHIIPPSHPHDQGFPDFYRDQVGRRPADYYHAASLNAIALRGVAFSLYAGVAILANFGTRIADMKYKARVMRGHRCRRQIGRALAGLVARGYLRKHSQMHYSLTGRVERRDNARLRPVRPALLHAALNPDTALYARFMLAIAATRRKWDRWTWRHVQSALHCDTGTAQALYRGFQTVRAMRKGGTLQAAKRAVFACERPEWYRYREHDGGRVLFDPRPGAAGLLQGGGSENVPPGDRRIGVHVREALTSRAWPGPELGGKPPGQNRRQCDQRVAALVLRQVRAKRRRGRLTAIDSDDVPATRATAPPCGGHMENETLTAGSVGEGASGLRPAWERTPPSGSMFEQLIAGMPAASRAKLERDPRVVAERRRRRLDQGYKA